MPSTQLSRKRQLQLRNLSPITADTYLRAVERFARYYNLSPEKMGPDQVREYLLHLMNDNEVVASTILINRSALHFLYVATLQQKWFDEEIARPKLPAHATRHPERR
jgi:integrase/recombinase XerD